MNLCDRCSDPGRCCRSLPLKRGDEHVTFWLATWQEDARKFAAEEALPFEPEAIVGEWLDKEQNAYVALSWSCPHVTPEGRCDIYESRPDLCRNYEPAADHLCTMMPPTNQAYVPDMRRFGL